jgi:hypothetical protein
MNLFLRCFGCKKQSKKKKNDANSSNVKFNSFVNQEINLRNNISLNQEKKISKENEKNHDTIFRLILNVIIKMRKRK